MDVTDDGADSGGGQQEQHMGNMHIICTVRKPCRQWCQTCVSVGGVERWREHGTVGW